jgi:hypothetical protein
MPTIFESIFIGAVNGILTSFVIYLFVLIFYRKGVSERRTG